MLALVDNGTHFLSDLQRALDAIGVGFEIVDGRSRVPPPDHIAYSGIILTGGDVHVNEPTQLAKVSFATRIIELATIPVLGICLGHQLVAHHYGATIEPLPQPVDRQEMIEIVLPDPLFEKLRLRFRTRVSHDDQVVELQPPLVALARSAVSEFEAIRHLDRPVYGLQFHPEDSGDSGFAILENFVRLCQSRAATWRAGEGGGSSAVA